MEKYEKPCMEVVDIQKEIITNDESYDESESFFS